MGKFLKDSQVQQLAKDLAMNNVDCCSYISARFPGTLSFPDDVYPLCTESKNSAARERRERCSWLNAAVESSSAARFCDQRCKNLLAIIFENFRGNMT